MHYSTRPSLWLQAVILFGELYYAVGYPDPMTTSPPPRLEERYSDTIGWYSTDHGCEYFISSTKPEEYVYILTLCLQIQSFFVMAA